MIDVVERTALFGGEPAVLPDGSIEAPYRYRLERVLAPTFGTLPGYVLWAMLNPSKADHRIDDQTIKRCMYYTYREGYARLVVVNLYALRATVAAELRRHPSPCGPDNDRHIAEEAAGAALTVVAWGSDPMVPARAAAVRELLGDRELLCLGTNDDGQPKHPCRLGNVVPLVPWPVA